MAGKAGALHNGSAYDGEAHCMQARGVRQTGVPRRHVYTDRIWRWLLAVVCVGCLTGFSPPKLVDREGVASQKLTVGELRAWAETAQEPEIHAKAWLLYDVDADRVLYSSDAESALPPASLTKLMTALLVLEHGQLESQVTVSADDVADVADGTTMGLVAGETITAQDLLWGLLVASGNDAALALARHVAGDVDSFVAQMNGRAAELGLHETHYVNPHGFDAPEHVTSAADLLTLTKELMAYPLFREIVGTKAIEVAGHELVNTNELLGVMPDADGVKTGTTTEAGECLVASFTFGGHQVIVIVLGSDDRYGDVRSLLDLYRANYTWVRADAADLAVMNRLYGDEGEVWHLAVQGEAPEELMPRWGETGLNGVRVIETEDTRAYEKGAEVGKLEWRVGDRVVGTQTLTVR